MWTREKKGDSMVDDTSKAPTPAKPVKKAAVKAAPKASSKPAPKAAAPKVSRPAQPPKPAKPKKGPTVDSMTDTPIDADTKTATQSLKDSASKLTKEAGDKARAYAEDGKARAGGVLDELAKMMTDAAGTVDEKVGPQYGQYARSAADAVSGFSESIKQKNLDDLIEDARGFVKKSPAVAIGTAAAIGFVLVRLIKSGLDAADRDEA
jgi:ElaB/YqjD/DUF883 family membrane-anchored ribosome-binding protein